MQLEWFGQSAFRLTDGATTVFIDPFGDVSWLTGQGLQWDYVPISGVSADMLLVTHEHGDHNGVEAIGGDPVVLRSTPGTHESQIGEVVGVAAEHDAVAGTSNGAMTLFVSTLGAEQAATIAGQLGARLVVPHHYRTARVDWLEPVDGMAERFARVHRAETPVVDLDALPDGDGPLLVLPAAP
jgi:L-ascorbate metabolism protein UlaG (beta-lactamase superfamily)